MFNKSLLPTLFTLLVILPATASAAQFPCSTSIQFEPAEVSINKDDTSMVPVLMTYMTDGEGETCNYNFNIYNPDGDIIGKTVKIDSIIDLSNDNFSIDFNKNDFLAKEMKTPGIYSLEIHDTTNESLKGLLSINLTEGEVLGIFHNREDSSVYFLLAASILFAGGVGVYVTKKIKK